MVILLDYPTLPKSGIFELNIQKQVKLNYSATEARKKVDMWLMHHVAMMLGAEEPILFVGKKIVWQVPIVLTAPHVGRVGQVGVIDVDVKDGVWEDTEEVRQNLLEQAQIVGAKIPPFKPRNLPPEFFPNKPTPVLTN